MMCHVFCAGDDKTDAVGTAVMMCHVFCAGDDKTDAVGTAVMLTENTQLMNRDSCLTKYDQDAHSAAGSNSTLSNNSQNRLYEKLGFSRQHLHTVAVLGIAISFSQKLITLSLASQLEKFVRTRPRVF